MAFRRRKPRSAQSGSVSLVAAVCMVAIVAGGACALDLSRFYLAQMKDQRIADQSAIAAAFAYSQASGSASVASAAAQNLATVNGAGTSTVTTTIVTSPSGDGNKAAKVVVQSSVTLSPFGSVVMNGLGNSSGTTTTMPVSATAYAEIVGNMAACIIALDASGYAASGGTSLTATGCSLASGGNVTGSGGSITTAQAIYAVGSVTTSGGASITTSPTAGQIHTGVSAPTDPFASAGVFSRVATVAALAAPSFPSKIGSAPSGGNAMTCSDTLTLDPRTNYYGTVSTSYWPTCSTINFSGGSETDIGGSGLQLKGNAVTLNFAAGTYKINGISISDSTAVTINLSGAVVLEIWNGITTSGSASLTINGTGTYYIQGGITHGSSGALTITNTSSTSNSTFYVSGGIDIANGPASFPQGTYVITSGNSSAAGGYGIYVNGGSTATFGNGSFNIAGGIYLGGGGSLTFGSALASSSVFQVTGTNTSTSSGYALQTNGGSNLTIGSFTNVDLNGQAQPAGNVSLGAGTYTINGALNAASSGGNAFAGSGVSIVTSGAISFGAGYSSVTLTAPTTVTSATNGTASTVALASQSSSYSTVTSGASNTLVLGAVYTPNAVLTLNGAGKLYGGGGCLEVVADSITLYGAGSISTTCTGVSGTASSAAKLIQ